MTESSAIFSADSNGVVTPVGWGDPSNVGLGGTTSQPLTDDFAADLTES